MTSNADSRSLPAGLSDLLETFRSPIASLECLTALPSGVRSHAAFKVQFANGEVVKARQVETAAQADRIRAIRRTLPDDHFPKILAHRGSALIEEWIDGRPVQGEQPEPSTLNESGRLLGLIHCTDPPEDYDFPSLATAENRLAWLERQTRELVERGEMSPREREKTIESAQRHKPDQCEGGLIHRDFCAENLILDRNNRLHAVDNETMRLDVLDFDLARTWYRWPMSADDWKAFLDGYRTHRSSKGFERHFLFWSLSALVDTFLYRVSAATADPHFPYRRIRALLSEYADD